MDKIKSTESIQLDAAIKRFSPFIVELRKRLIFTFCIFATSSLAGFVFYEQIIKFLIDILGLKGINIVFTSPFQFINLATSCGVVVGLVIISPFLITQVLSFLKPALRMKEFSKVVRLLPFSIILFLLGFTFGALIMRWQIQLSLTRSVSLGIGNILDISRLLSTILLTSAFMGLGFQFPIVLLLLMFLGISDRKQLSRQRHWVYLGSFIFAILLPPDSILADVLLSLPFILLFELTLIIDFVSSFKKQESDFDFV